MKAFGLSMIGLALISIPTICPAEHPNHMSVAEIQWNAETGNLEVAICLWPADLERAIAQMRDQPTNLETVRNRDRILEDYIAQHFVVTSSNRSKHELRHNIHWVGSEIDAKQAWLYFEFDGSQFGEFVTVSNSVLFEINPDQSNHVQFQSGSVRKYAMATSGNREMEFERARD
jgi:hypothetical protein